MRDNDLRAAAVLTRLSPDLTVAAVHHGDETIVGIASEPPMVARGVSALVALDTLPPGLWVGFCTFELGHALERVVPRSHPAHPSDGADLPDLVFARLDARAVIGPDGAIRIDGEGEGRALLERASECGDALAALGSNLGDGSLPGPRDLDDRGWQSSLTRAEHAARCAVVGDHLASGDCYQVNLTRRLTTDVALDPVALYGRLAARHPSPHAAMLRAHFDGRVVSFVSASPEGYLRRRGTAIETSPIKGTGVDAMALARSAKDRAENVIIVDLARNDLGRVCEAGSIHVPSLCAVEQHPGLHHLVSTVRGQLRPGVGIGGLIAATFPPASVTGAPKPRVLQIIEDLEPVPRGIYCGAVGWIDTEHDDADLAVAIRTFTILGQPGDVDGCTQLGVGGGIVADSDPGSEWRETQLKAARLLDLASLPVLAGT